MADDTQVIRERIDQTRASLAEKLDTLETQVVETAQEATEAVAETVDRVQDAVEETVATVKDTVQETMTTVKDMLNVEVQVERHPWLMFGGAVALGYLGERFTDRLSPQSPRMVLGVPRSSPAPRALTREFQSAPAGLRDTAVPPPAVKGDTSTGASHWYDPIRPELNQLKGLAIGTAVGILRDVLANSVPNSMVPSLTEVMDNATVKLGGKPLQGPILN
jgi:ElaB/YqjD/DUF883 family membrane-anchored ribosome-binding protein